MFKTFIKAAMVAAVFSTPAMAGVTQSQSTSVGVVGASVNNIGAAGVGLSSAVGLATNTNVLSQTTNANPTNVNLNSLHQLDQQLQGQLQ